MNGEVREFAEKKTIIKEKARVLAHIMFFVLMTWAKIKHKEFQKKKSSTRGHHLRHCSGHFSLS